MKKCANVIDLRGGWGGPGTLLSGGEPSIWVPPEATRRADFTIRARANSFRLCETLHSNLTIVLMHE